MCGYDIGPLRVPGHLGSVDVVVTLSFEYRVTSGTGTIRTWFVADGPKWLRMKPGPYRLSSPGGDWTSTTLTWFRRDLPGGQRYDFHAVTTPNPSADMFARRVIAIIDVRPAGAG